MGTGSASLSLSLWGDTSTKPGAPLVPTTTTTFEGLPLLLVVKVAISSRIDKAILPVYYTVYYIRPSSQFATLDKSHGATASEKWRGRRRGYDDCSTTTTSADKVAKKGLFLRKCGLDVTV